MVICGDFIEPLNLRCLLVNTFAGNVELFSLLSFVFISAMAAYFRMGGLTFVLSSILFIIIGVSLLDLSWALILLIIFGGFFIFRAIGKIVK